MYNEEQAKEKEDKERDEQEKPDEKKKKKKRKWGEEVGWKITMWKQKIPPGNKKSTRK